MSNPPQQPQPSNRSKQPSQRSSSRPELAPKPYAFVSFPKQPPNLKSPVGHHKYLPDHFHGILCLTLNVQTALHIATGVIVMGSDVGSRVPLIKTMTQGVNQKLVIQGSSFKGCLRAVYEAITNSTLAVITSKHRSKIPTERLPCRNKQELCPASLVFGALDWQGLIEFSDAICEKADFATGFMPSLYRPRPEQSNAYFTRGMAAGRKFYYHTVRSIDKGQNAGIAVQQAARAYTFKTELHFMNLRAEELGTLFTVLGQDPNYPIALKVGGGKPIGMGTMTITVDAIDQSQNITSRYYSYQISQSDRLTGENMKEFIQGKIQVAHRTGLIQKQQLEELSAVLLYPTDRQPPAGMY